MNLIDLTYPPSPEAALPKHLALLFGFVAPPKVCKPTRSHRIEPDSQPSAYRKTGPKSHAEMVAATKERRLSIVAMLQDTGEATTGEVAGWCGIRTDVALSDMRRLEKDGLVRCRMESRSGHQTNIWEAA